MYEKTLFGIVFLLQRKVNSLGISGPSRAEGFEQLER